ncbi:MAG: diphthine synthase [Methanosarcinaceae archaeon]|nr:diphthine synthase [Methanosarcinaceae archaeon]
MLTFIGLGLFDENDVSLKGLECIKNADKVYLEFYTSILVGTNIEKMETLYNKKIHILSREEIEQNPDWIYEAKDKDIVFLTGGDTMVSTTHVDLRLRAIKANIKTSLIHGASILTAISGLTGLQNYRFGKSTTIPYPFKSQGKTIISNTPYDTIKKNMENDLHTILFLDIDSEKGFMSVNEALKILLEVEQKRKEGLLDNIICVGIAQAGSMEPIIKADYLNSLKDFDFGNPLHILVVPAELHFIESESLVKICGGPIPKKSNDFNSNEVSAETKELVGGANN